MSPLKEGCKRGRRCIRIHGDSVVVPKTVARNCVVSAKSGVAQAKTTVGLKTLEGFAATAIFPEPNVATFTFFCTMEN